MARIPLFQSGKGKQIAIIVTDHMQAAAATFFEKYSYRPKQPTSKPSQVRWFKGICPSGIKLFVIDHGLKESDFRHREGRAPFLGCVKLYFQTDED
jgi:hypothetical protein